jgi:hypothetical protein
LFSPIFFFFKFLKTITKHLNICEEKIFDSLVWVGAASPFIASLQDHAARDHLASVMEAALYGTATSQKIPPTPPRGVGMKMSFLEHFFKRFMSIAGRRTHELCANLQLPFRVYNNVGLFLASSFFFFE